MISAAAMPTTSSPSDPPTAAVPVNVDFAQKRKENGKILDAKPQESTAKVDKWNLLKVRVGFDVTRKGERSLVIDGYKFTKSRDGMSDRVFWRCSRRECKATAVTVGGRVEHVRILHTHQPPTPGEFFSTAGETAAHLGPGAVSRDQTVRQHDTGRVRRRSHHHLGTATATSTNDAPDVVAVAEKTAGAHARAVAAILSNLVECSKTERKQPETNEMETVNGFSPPSSVDKLQDSRIHTSQEVISVNQRRRTFPPVSFGADNVRSHYQHPSVGDFDSRGLNALADAAVHQSKRDSQNSTPDPPFEAPGSSPPPPQQAPHLPQSTEHVLCPFLTSEKDGPRVTATPVGGPFVFLGTRDLPTPFLVGNSFSGAGTADLSTPAASATSTSCQMSSVVTDSVSGITVSGLPSTPMVSLPGSSCRPSALPSTEYQEVTPPDTPNEPTLARIDLQPALTSTAAGVGMLLHWKKEKMRESEAEEEMRQHHLGRQLTTAAAVATSKTFLSFPSDGNKYCDGVEPAVLGKRKRCASASQPPLSTRLYHSGPRDPRNLLTSAANATPHQIPLSDWYVRVMKDMLPRLLTTLQRLTARLEANSDAEDVITTCRAIQACLDTVSALRRARQESVSSNPTF
uniref:FLYWCH-type domain-containing protein n=1 Tax=Mesocestoides corti TaxID=53468 RepID=A0A5K3FHA1_MESCO